MNIKTILLLLFCNAGYAASAVLLKLGMSKIGKVDLSMSGLLALAGNVLVSPLLICGFLVTGLSSLLFLVLLSKYNLNYVYPLLSFVYVFTALAGLLVLGERMNYVNWAGIMFVCIGVALISIRGAF